MRYSRRLWRQAVAETRRYWTPKRIAATVGGPVFIGILWALFKPWVGWAALMQVIVISILGFFALWGLVFVVSLIESPAQLDAARGAEHEKTSEELRGSIVEKTARIAELTEALSKKHPHDEHKERQAAQALASLSPDERNIIVWLLDAGKVSRFQLQKRGLNVDSLYSGPLAQILAYDSIRPGNGLVEMDRHYYINPSMADALRNILHPPRPVTPPSG